MRIVKSKSGDPVVIGRCAACGHPIFSNEDYYISEGEMIHAKGVGAIAKVAASNRTVYISCLFLHLQQEQLEDEAAEMFGIELKRV